MYLISIQKLSFKIATEKISHFTLNGSNLHVLFKATQLLHHFHALPGIEECCHLKRKKYLLQFSYLKKKFLEILLIVNFIWKLEWNESLLFYIFFFKCHKEIYGIYKRINHKFHKTYIVLKTILCRDGIIKLFCAEMARYRKNNNAGFDASILCESEIQRLMFLLFFYPPHRFLNSLHSFYQL